MPIYGGARRVLGASGINAPTALSGLSLWFDADDVSTITIATGVSQWNDKSGGGYHATQATGSKQPARATGVQNGRAVLRFDDTASQLLTSSLTRATFTTSALSLFVVGTRRAANGAGNEGNFAYLGNANAVAPNFDWLGIGVSNGRAAQFGNYSNPTERSVVSTGLLTDTTFYILSGILNDAGTNRLFVNGAADGTTTFIASGIDSAQAWTLGERGPQTGAGTGYLNGDIGEIVLYNRALSSSERRKVERYLSKRWGISVT